MTIELEDVANAEGRSCEEHAAIASEYAACRCAGRVNAMEGSTDEGCDCGSDDTGDDGESTLVDLIVLVDSSGSMSEAWSDIADAAEVAIERAQEECEKDVEAHFVYVDGLHGATDSGPLTGPFVESHEQHLINRNFSGPFRTEVSDGANGEGGPDEEGAEAIIDLVRHHPWREGACRSILYVSDTWLDSGNALIPSDPEDRATARTDEAIAEANAMGVTIFAHHVSGTDAPGGPSVAASAALYTKLTAGTNGDVAFGPTSSTLYNELIHQAICQACANSSRCLTAELPELAPCIEVRWGAAECDGVESHDDEIICVTVCNCYRNVTFTDFTIGCVVAVDEAGNVGEVLPDGNRSIEVVPAGPVCFGDIGPCGGEEPNCVTREFVLLTRSAAPGTYRLKLGGICFSTVQHRSVEQEFTFEVCPD